MSDRDEQIRKRAYEIWEREGRPEGLQQRHWEQAAEEIANEESRQGGGTETSGTADPVTAPDKNPAPGNRKPRNKS